jgi:hypothetical protein
MLKRLDQFCHVIPLASMLLALAGDAVRYSGLCLWPSYTLAPAALLCSPSNARRIISTLADLCAQLRQGNCDL